MKWLGTVLQENVSSQFSCLGASPFCSQGWAQILHVGAARPWLASLASSPLDSLFVLFCSHLYGRLLGLTSSLCLTLLTGTPKSTCKQASAEQLWLVLQGGKAGAQGTEGPRRLKGVWPRGEAMRDRSALEGKERPRSVLLSCIFSASLSSVQSSSESTTLGNPHSHRVRKCKQAIIAPFWSQLVQPH